MSTVLILTHQKGFEADPVIDSLRKKDIPVFRFNADDGETPSEITYNPEEIAETELVCDDRRIQISDIGAAWYQQTPPYQGAPANQVQTTQRSSLVEAQMAIMEEIPSVKWLNRPTSVMIASNKALQLKFAGVVGLRIPQTIISNNAERIRKFAEKQPTVIKNIASPWFVEGQRTHAAFTKIIESEWLKEDEALTFCPAIYQAFVPRVADYRVVLVNGIGYIASMTKQLPVQREDVRRGVPTNTGHTKANLDPLIITKLNRLMRFLQLDYCSADLIEDAQGNIYFLELNTCGSWWWIDELYDGAICETIVQSLVSKMT